MKTDQIMKLKSQENSLRDDVQTFPLNGLPTNYTIDKIKNDPVTGNIYVIMVSSLI